MNKLPESFSEKWPTKHSWGAIKQTASDNLKTEIYVFDEWFPIETDGGIKLSAEKVQELIDKYKEIKQNLTSNIEI